MRPETARLIAEAEVKAERTVAAVRIFVALALGLIFVLQVVPNFAGASDLLRSRILFAALSLVTYLLLGIVSLRIAGSPGYRPWMSWLFAAMDVGFILFTLDHSLRSTALPANYLPLVVAIWLAPLVLAFGALRYSPFLQGFVTLGIVGGIIFLAFKAGIDPADSAGPVPQALTQIFGLPPNLIRLTMLSLAGAILVLAAVRTRTLLRRAVDESRKRGNLTRYLPPQIAEWLSDASPEEIRGGRRQTVTILFADIRGFTARAQTLAPSALTRFIGGFRKCVTDAAEAHGGVIDKFVGDSAMVVFGIPDATADDARNAIACARAILKNVAAWNTDLAAEGTAPAEIGIGVHRGEVFYGAVGDDARLEFTVLGDPVNVAARIEQETKSAGYPLLVSRVALEAAGGAPDGSDWTALPQRMLRGHDAPIDLMGTGRPEKRAAAEPSPVEPSSADPSPIEPMPPASSPDKSAP